MRYTQGAMGHREIMQLPWAVFMAYCTTINRMEQRTKEARFIRNPGLHREWEENRERWLASQPPPPGVN